MIRRARAIVVCGVAASLPFVTAAACKSSSGNDTPPPPLTDAAPSDAPTTTTTGTGPVSLAVPASIASVFPVDDAGRPILSAPQNGGALPSGVTVQIVYDQALDDPITAWGDCLGRVITCKQAAAGGSIASCVAAIDACATSAGGRGCCPKGCLAAFASAIAAGTSEGDAVQQVFVAGDCIDGFASRRDAADTIDGGAP